MIKVISIVKNYNLTSHGTGGAGFYAHKGITVFLSNGEQVSGYFKFNSRSYGNFQVIKDESKYNKLNGRKLDKHSPYEKDVKLAFEVIMILLLETKEKEYKNKAAVIKDIRICGVGNRVNV